MINGAVAYTPLANATLHIDDDFWVDYSGWLTYTLKG
jgi:hypothetical protein